MADIDHRSSAEIEREIEEERNALTRTLDEIQDRLSFEALSGNMMGAVREHGGDIGRSLSRSVRDNPIPLALTAIGLAWLAMSNRSSGYDEYEYEDDYAEPRYASARSRTGGLDYRSSYAREGYRGSSLDDDNAVRSSATFGSAAWSAGTAARPRPVYDASGRPLSPLDDDHSESRWDKARHRVSEMRSGMSDRLHSGRDAAASQASSAAGSTSDAAHRSGSAASDAMHRGGEAVSDAASRARSGMSGAATRARSGLDRAASGVRRRGQGAYASAAELRERITDGTRDLSEQARARVLAARTRAYEAQLRAEHYARRGRDKAADLYEDQPVVAGALALAFGAAVGAMLPSTRREDDAFGGYRDELFEEAERIYREEREKIADVARTTADEAKRVARETADDLKSDAQRTLNEAGTKAKDAARDVADTAKSEADKKNLGHPG